MVTATTGTRISSHKYLRITFKNDFMSIYVVLCLGIERVLFNFRQLHSNNIL
ncbi:MAG: hypothetical protein JWR50_3630 [Mucilaginibacter sp.]|nr:hypothetical protein [Mucilaginibacter sp.]